MSTLLDEKIIAAGWAAVRSKKKLTEATDLKDFSNLPLDEQFKIALNKGKEKEEALQVFYSAAVKVCRNETEKQMLQQYVSSVFEAKEGARTPRRLIHR